MNDEFDELSPEEKMEAENNLLKLKLMAEYGAQFPDPEHGLKDPYIENQWLHYISEYEKIHKDAKCTTVYEFIGKPEYLAPENLDKIRLEEEMSRLEDIFGKTGIDLSFICDYDTLTKYKFITEEFFWVEMEDIRIEGMTNCFIYEEFHPNHEYDLKGYSNQFLNALLTREWTEFDEHQINKEMLTACGQPIEGNEFIERIQLFQSTWKRFKIIRSEVVRVEFDLEKGEALVEISLEYKAGKGKTAVRFSGPSLLHFIYRYDYWYLNRAAIPGFNM